MSYLGLGHVRISLRAFLLARTNAAVLQGAGVQQDPGTHRRASSGGGTKRDPRLGCGAVPDRRAGSIPGLGAGGIWVEVTAHASSGLPQRGVPPQPPGGSGLPPCTPQPPKTLQRFGALGRVHFGGAPWHEDVGVVPPPGHRGREAPGSHHAQPPKALVQGGGRRAGGISSSVGNTSEAAGARTKGRASRGACSRKLLINSLY